MATKDKKLKIGRDAKGSRAEKLASVVSGANKEFGKAIMLSPMDDSLRVVPRVSTGLYGLDVASNGGLPIGRVTMVYGLQGSGKTMLLLRSLANAQRLCGNCYGPGVFVDGEIEIPNLRTGKIETVKTKVIESCPCGNPRDMIVLWVDAENVWETSWSRRMGVWAEKVILVKPSYGEQAYDLVSAFVSTKEIDLIGIDSLAQLTPIDEYDSAMGEQFQGLAARMNNKFLRKLIGGMCDAFTDGRPITFWMINQYREKIGVMFGCFEYGAMVVLADGSRVKIGEIVRDRMDVDVLSVEDGMVVPRRVVGWHENGRTEKWLRMKVSRNGTASQFKCTHAHRIATEDGFVRADSLCPGDVVLSLNDVQLSGYGSKLVLWMAIGDGHIRVDGDHPSGCLIMEHSYKQAEYARWKGELIAPLLGASGATKRKTWEVRTMSLWGIRKVRDLLYCDGQKTFTDDVAKMISPLCLAIWYMDDGCLSRRTRWGSDRCSLSVHSFSESDRQRIVDFFMSIGCECSLYGGNLMFTTDGTIWFQEMICCHVPECMQHKLSPAFQGRYVDFDPGEKLLLNERELVPRKVLSVEEVGVVSSGGHRKPSLKYDLTVEGGGCYFVSDVLVHNSPNVLPGGKGQQFATSLEIETRKGKVDVDKEAGEALIGNFSWTVKKNKVGVPGGNGEYQICLAQTDLFDVGDLMEHELVIGKAVDLGLIDRPSASIYEYNGKKFRGKSQLVRYLGENSEMYEDLKLEMVRIKLGIEDGIPE